MSSQVRRTSGATPTQQDYVTGLAGFPGFAELKRSLRERPQLRGFGVDPDAPGDAEDWHAGRRKPPA